VADLLPLFPLEVVLFPGAALPLHIFEPRYKEMIGECLQQKLAFGVVLVKEKALARVGCTADITSLLKTYDDGRMDIMSQGSRRFEIVQLNEERSFLRGDVLYFDDEGDEASRQQREQVADLHRELLALGASDPQKPDVQQPQLAFQLAASVPLDLDFKQALLAMRSESERVATMISYYNALIPKLRVAIRARTKAGGNGHVA
jgi:Lon protease-like protein